MHVLLEDSMKRRLAARGVTTPTTFRVAHSAAEAVLAADELGDAVVVKALVGVGDRGRKNLVRSADTPEAARGAAEQMLGTVIDGQVVDRVLVELMASPGSEYFIGFGFDYSAASCRFPPRAGRQRSGGTWHTPTGTVPTRGWPTARFAARRVRTGACR